MKKRSYHQRCYLAQASDFLGERWTLLIFRELLIQPCRFKDLQRYLEGMGTNLLTQRLKELERYGMIEKQNPQEKRSPYQLTIKGRSVEAVVLPLILWGSGFSPFEQEGLHFPHWDLLAMKALFLPKNCHQAMTIQFCSAELEAWVAIAKNAAVFELNDGLSFTLTHGMGKVEHADVLLPMTIAEFQQQVQLGNYQDDVLLKHFIRCFKSYSQS